jgi:hypothetical protein
MHKFAMTSSVLELNDARNFGKEGIVASDPYIKSRFVSCPPLPHDNRTPGYELAGETLHPQSLGLAVSTVPGASYSLFVCHTETSLACYINFLDEYFRIRLAMSARSTVLFFRLIFENQDFIVLALGFQNAFNGSSLNQRFADICFVIGFNKKDFVELNRSIRFGFKLFHAYGVAFSYSVLLSAAFYHCVHNLTSRAK